MATAMAMAKGLTTLLLIALHLGRGAANGEWDYHEHGPAEWPALFPACAAARQSPLALLRSRAALLPRAARAFSLALRGYGAPADAAFANNGHTVALTPDYSAGAAPRVLLEGTDADGAYALSGLHFHWPSEHTVDGRRFDLEMHMVHKDAATNRTLVLGFLFEACWASGSGVGALAALLPRLARPGASVAVPAFVPARVMPLDYQCDYFLYSGSLTTPPCSQDVTWLVHAHPTCIAQEQLKNFYSVLDEEGEPLAGNFRPLQPRNGRNLFYQSCSF